MGRHDRMLGVLRRRRGRLSFPRVPGRMRGDHQIDPADEVLAVLPPAVLEDADGHVCELGAHAHLGARAVAVGLSESLNDEGGGVQVRPRLRQRRAAGAGRSRAARRAGRGEDGRALGGHRKFENPAFPAGAGETLHACTHTHTHIHKQCE